MTSISFYVDYCFEAGNENCNSNLTGRYEFLMEFSDEMSVELYKIWCENNYELNSWNSNWDGHDDLYYTINQIATEMLNKMLDDEDSGIKNITTYDVLWEISQKTIDELNLIKDL